MKNYYCAGTMVFCLFVTTLKAQTAPFHEFYSSGAGIGAYSQQFTNVFTTDINQAGLANIHQLSIGAYAQRRFMLAATSWYALAAAMPVGKLTIGGSINYFGNKAFNQQLLGIALGKSLGKWLDVGWQIDYLTLHMQQYGSTSTVTAEAGIITHPVDQLSIGMHVFNPLPTSYHRLKENKIPRIYTLAAGYDASKNFYISLQVMHGKDHYSWQTAFQYHIAKQLFIQAGMAISPASYFIGVGMNTTYLHIIFNASFQSPLGLSPSAEILYHPKILAQ